MGHVRVKTPASPEDEDNQLRLERGKRRTPGERRRILNAAEVQILPYIPELKTLPGNGDQLLACDYNWYAGWVLSNRNSS